MKKLLLLLAVLIAFPVVGAQAQSRSSRKPVSPIIEGKKKVRESSYDSIWQFTTFEDKKIYYCNFDYRDIATITDKRKPDWGTFAPVMSRLLKVSRTPMRFCPIFAINPNITDEDQREALVQEAIAEAENSAKTLIAFMKDEKMTNKVQYNVAQVDYRYWCGSKYFSNPQPEEDIIAVGCILFFGTKKIDLFPNATADARKFNDIKFFPNDATIQVSYNSLLDDLANYLKEDDRFEVLLSGYSDNQGTETYIIGLSRQRVTEVKKALMLRGIAEYRIEVEAKGDANPIGDNNTYEGRIANNRVSITIQ